MTLKKMVDGREVDMTPEEEKAIRAEWEQNATDPMQYARDRRAAYPPITDYVDAIVKGDAAALAAYIAACREVKQRYPKPG